LISAGEKGSEEDLSSSEIKKALVSLSGRIQAPLSDTTAPRTSRFKIPVSSFMVISSLDRKYFDMDFPHRLLGRV
jgi:hypothetical protein